jgi:Smg protein
MFEVLAYVYENYWRGDACPEPQQLGRKLSAVGFDPDEIQQALTWLDGLSLMAHGTTLGASAAEGADAPAAPSDIIVTDALLPGQSPDSLRVFSVAEQDHLGAPCLGFLSFLESSGVLPPAMREIVLDRAMAAPGDPVSLEDFKIIVLMVYWTFGEEPDALILDELCDDTRARVAH